MKLVIDIYDNIYTRLFDNGSDVSIIETELIKKSIRNGTPLPKEHGRLIDANAIWNYVPDITNPLENHLTTYDLQDIIEKTPTIIEADRNRRII